MPSPIIGADFIVNSTTVGTQYTPGITALADGRFVVTWVSDEGSGTSPDIRGRIYNADGTPEGDDFIVNTTMAGNQEAVGVVSLSDGRFVVSWMSGEGGSQPQEIRARVYEADGTPTGDDFIVNSTTAGEQSYPSISALSEGRFLVAWRSNDAGSSFDIRARVYNADGSAADDFIVANTGAIEEQSSVTGLSNGGFVVTWTTVNGGYDIRGRLYQADGVPVGGDFAIGTSPSEERGQQNVIGLNDGRFLITWASREGSASYEVRGRLYNADGTPAGSDFLVNTTSAGQQYVPSATSLSDGRFVVSWYSDETGGEIRCRLFDADGQPAGDDFILNTTTGGLQYEPSIAALSDGRVVASWLSFEESSSYEIRGTILSMTPVAVADTASATEAGIEAGANASGNVLTNDIGDSKVVSAVQFDGMPGMVGAALAGAYGMLTLDADGGYSYVVDDANLTVDALANGESLTEIFTYTVEDGSGATAEATLTINIEGANDAPVITSNGGSNTAAVSLAENGVQVTVVAGADIEGDALGFSISGGADAGHFVIDSETGQLTFASAPDYDMLADADANNIYDVQVQVSDGHGGTDIQTLAVTVTNVGGITLTSNAAIINGTSEEDVLTGQNAANTINGLGGHDTLNGGDNTDTLNGDDGNDTLNGGAGNDTLNGGNGADILVGGIGNDTASGGDGSDTILYTIGEGNDIIDGGGDTDRLNVIGTDIDNTLTAVFDGAKLTKVLANTLTSVEEVAADMRAGADTLAYQTTTASVTVNLATGAASGFISIANFENATGGSGADLLIGNDGANTLSGGVGDDHLLGGLGSDVLIGGTGTDTVSCAGETDAMLIDLVNGAISRNAIFEDTLNSIEDVTGGSGNDVIIGSAGVNRLDGGAGDDDLSGGAGNDTLYGGDNDDRITGGKGNDTVDGGNGNDRIFHAIGDGVDTVDGGDGGDQLEIAGTTGADQLDVIFNGIAINQSEGGAVANVEAVFANLDAGLDRLSYAGSDVDVVVDLALGQASGFASISGIENVTGGSGNDVFKGDSQANNFAGGAGNDIYSLAAGDSVTEAAASGIDQVLTSLGSVTLSANVENLTYTGSGGFVGTGNASDNVIIGGSKNDTLSGAAGNDTIVGGAGTDVLRGGADLDTFVFAPGFGNDTIVDFDADGTGGQDLLNISAFGITGTDFAGRVLVEDLGFDTMVTVDGVDSVRLLNVNSVGANTITMNDFLLA